MPIAHTCGPQVQALGAFARVGVCALCDALRLATRELRAALAADDLLGFDHFLGAAHAVLTHDDFAARWECSLRTVSAVRAYKRACSPNMEVVS